MLTVILLQKLQGMIVKNGSSYNLISINTDESEILLNGKIGIQFKKEVCAYLAPLHEPLL